MTDRDIAVWSTYLILVVELGLDFLILCEDVGVVTGEFLTDAAAAVTAAAASFFSLGKESF